MSFIKNKKIQLQTMFILNKEERKARRKELEEKYYPNTLIMTLLVKDEADIIRENILFHRAMGVDGIIVTDNNSTDGTLEILKELKAQGNILEIIEEPATEYYQALWVDRMIKLATKKYKADWIINADADEFWHSKSLNLKRDIIEEAGKDKNVLNSILKDFIPVENKIDFLSSPYFINRELKSFESEIIDLPACYYNFQLRIKKVIHKTKGYKMITQGNHHVKMQKNQESYSNSINIYHYFVRNYKHFEEKTIKGGKSHEKLKDKNVGSHWRKWYELYKDGKLSEEYNNLYHFDKINDLIEMGVIAKDAAIINFLKHKNIK